MVFDQFCEVIQVNQESYVACKKSAILHGERGITNMSKSSVTTQANGLNLYQQYTVCVQECRYQRIFHHEVLHYRLPGILEQAAGTPVPKGSLALETMGIECRILWKIIIIKPKTV